MSELFLRYALELAVVFPASGYCLLSVRKQLRWPEWLTWLLAAAADLVFVCGGAWLSMRSHQTGLPMVLLALVLFYPLYLAAADLAWDKLLFCFTNSMMLIAFCTTYTNYLTAAWEMDDLPTFSPRSSLLCLGLAAVMGAVFFNTLRVKLPYLFSVPRLNRIWPWLTLAPAAFTLLLSWLVPQDLSNLLVGRMRQIALVVMPLFPLALLMLYHAFWWISRELRENARLTQENNLLQMESKRYDALRRYMDETRTLRHDFRQHVRVIGELSAAGDTERLSAYLQELEQAPRAVPGEYCANRAVDALCAWYTHRAQETEARISWMMELPESLPLPDAEFCAMLGNLLDNALRAVQELDAEQRKITVISRMLSDKMLGLSVENPYAGKLRLGADGLPRRRGPGRGLGLTSVAATVSRHHGSLTVRPENGLFSVDILLYC